MTFLLDENFPTNAAELLEGLGHSVYDIRRIGLAGVDDATVITKAKELGAVVLTTDRDFFHTLHKLQPEHPGLVVIALRQPTREAIIKRLQWFLQNIPHAQWPNSAFQLRDKTWMANPPIS